MPANPQSEQELLSRAYAMAGFTWPSLPQRQASPYRGISDVTRAGQGS